MKLRIQTLPGQNQEMEVDLQDTVLDLKVSVPIHVAFVGGANGALSKTQLNIFPNYFN